MNRQVLTSLGRMIDGIGQTEATHTN